MQQRLLLCMAVLCITAIPAFNARSLDNGERELMELAIQALESNQAMSAEESMVMQSGAYGAANMAGAYGGILDEPSAPTTPSIPATSALESGESNKPAATTATPAPAASTTAKKSSAVSAQQSAGLLAAGLMAAVFLL